MAHKPVSYDQLALVPDPDPELPASAAEPGESELLRDVAARLMLYVNPDFHKALARYALEQSEFRRRKKLHDICIEALEAWAQAHGINVPVRAKEPETLPQKRPRRR
jgi:hypothetical protein